MRKSPLPLEFLMPKNGKRYMDPVSCRGMQSKISLKFPLSSAVSEKPKMAPTIK